MAETKLIGRSLPLGATVVDGGANICLFSRTASGVELLFVPDLKGETCLPGNSWT
jgi:glycogen operon protein